MGGRGSNRTCRSELMRSQLHCRIFLSGGAFLTAIGNALAMIIVGFWLIRGGKFSAVKIATFATVTGSGNCICSGCC